MTADPVTQAPFWSQGLNRYSYVFNNPINNTDPSGFMADGGDSTTGIMAWGAGVTAMAAGGFSGLGMGALNPVTSAFMPSIGDGSAASTHGGAPPTTAPKGQGGGRGTASGASTDNKWDVGPSRPPDERLALNMGGWCAANPRACALGVEVATDVGRVIRTASGVAIVVGTLLTPSDTQTDDNEIRTGGVNLDTGALTALTQARNPALQAMVQQLIGSRIPVATTTALAEFAYGVSNYAGPIERANAAKVFTRVRAIPDTPSARASALRVTKGLGANDIKILGTGDALGIQTITSDARAVRAAAAQGVKFDVQEIPPTQFGRL